MRRDGETYAVVLVCGDMRGHARDWAGLCLACDRVEGVLVKPLDVVESTTRRKSGSEGRRAAKTSGTSMAVLENGKEKGDRGVWGNRRAALRLANAELWPIRRVDGAAIMERLTFARDENDNDRTVIGRVVNARDDGPPMVRATYEAPALTKEEREALALLGRADLASPETMRGGAEERGGGGGHESMSEVFSLFEIGAYARGGGTASDASSTPADVSSVPSTVDEENEGDTKSKKSKKYENENENENSSGAFSSPMSAVMGDSFSPDQYCDDEGDVTDDAMETEIPSAESQTEPSATLSQAPSSSVVWNGIKFLKESLAAQRGVHLILARSDVERLLEDMRHAIGVADE